MCFRGVSSNVVVSESLTDPRVPPIFYDYGPDQGDATVSPYRRRLHERFSESHVAAVWQHVVHVQGLKPNFYKHYSFTAQNAINV